jgi:hypothetical protein
MNTAAKRVAHQTRPVLLQIFSRRDVYHELVELYTIWSSVRFLFGEAVSSVVSGASAA